MNGGLFTRISIILILILWSYLRTHHVYSRLFTSPTHSYYQKAHSYVSRSITIKVNQSIDINCNRNTYLKECNFLSPTNQMYSLLRNEDKKCYDSKRICLFTKLPNKCVIRFSRIAHYDNGTWQCYDLSTSKQPMSQNHDAIIVQKQPTSILFDSFSLILDDLDKSKKSFITYLYSIPGIILFLALLLMVSFKNKYRIILQKNKDSPINREKWGIEIKK